MTKTKTININTLNTTMYEFSKKGLTSRHLLQLKEIINVGDHQNIFIKLMDNFIVQMQQYEAANNKTIDYKPYSGMAKEFSNLLSSWENNADIKYTIKKFAEVESISKLEKLLQILKSGSYSCNKKTIDQIVDNIKSPDQLAKILKKLQEENSSQNQHLQNKIVLNYFKHFGHIEDNINDVESCYAEIMIRPLPAIPNDESVQKIGEHSHVDGC